MSELNLLIGKQNCLVYSIRTIPTHRTKDKEPSWQINFFMSQLCIIWCNGIFLTHLFQMIT